MLFNVFARYMCDNQIDLSRCQLVAKAVTAEVLDQPRVFHHTLEFERFEVLGVGWLTVTRIHLVNLPQGFLMGLQAVADLVLLCEFDHLRDGLQLAGLVLQLYVLVSI